MKFGVGKCKVAYIYSRSHNTDAWIGPKIPSGLRKGKEDPSLKCHLNSNVCQQAQSIKKEQEGEISFLHCLNVQFAIVLNATFLAVPSQARVL